MLLFFLASFRISQIYILFIGSKPVVGSSKNINFELPVRAMPIWTLLFIPPESSLINLSLCSVNLTLLRFL